MDMAVRAGNRIPSASDGKIADRAGKCCRGQKRGDKHQKLHEFFVFCYKGLRAERSPARTSRWLVAIRQAAISDVSNATAWIINGNAKYGARWRAAMNELERSQGHRKPGAVAGAEPKLHPPERQPTAARVLPTGRGADALGIPTKFPLRHKEGRAQSSPYVQSLGAAKVVWVIPICRSS